MTSDLGPLLKAAYPQVVAVLTRQLGDIDQAMDATQDALVKAIQHWQSDGVPREPVAWLVTVAKRGAIDSLRRESRLVSIDSNVMPLPGSGETTVDVDYTTLSQVDDDMLRLLFTCCHPSLSPRLQIVLMLKVVLGFSVEDIARALLVSSASIEKRLSRAKRQLRDSEDDYQIPKDAELVARLDAVLRAVYLLFNEAYSRLEDPNIVQSSLIEEAIRLARIVSRLFRHHPQPRALLALLLLITGRLPARLNSQGEYVPLDEQDRRLWHQGRIREGVALIDALCAARHPPCGYQIQAAISAIHSQAARAADTDWPQIAALYERLQHYEASPAVPVNMAVAYGQSGDLDRAAGILADLEEQLANYQPFHAAKAFVAEQQSRWQDAGEAYDRAIELAGNAAQKRYLERRRQMILS